MADIASGIEPVEPTDPEIEWAKLKAIDGQRIEKVDYALAWVPYIGLLLEVAEEVDRAA